MDKKYSIYIICFVLILSVSFIMSSTSKEDNNISNNEVEEIKEETDNKEIEKPNEEEINNQEEPIVDDIKEENEPKFKYDLAFKYHEKRTTRYMLIDLDSDDIMFVNYNVTNRTGTVDVNYSSEYSYSGDVNNKIIVKELGALFDTETEYKKENDSLIMYYDGKPYDEYKKVEVNDVIEILEKYTLFNKDDYLE